MIREMTMEDVPRVAEMARDFHKYAIADKGLGFSPSDFVRHSIFLMESPIANILVLEIEGKAVGTIAGIVSPWFMDFSQLLLTELWWWVDPEHRKGNLSFSLLDALAEWGQYCGASMFTIVSIGTEREEIIKRYYKRKGFNHIETHFIKEI